MFVSELQFRFDQSNLKPLITIYNILTDQNYSPVDLKKEFIYKDEININKLELELMSFYSNKQIKNVSFFGDVINFFKPNANKNLFKNLYTLLKIYLTAPVTVTSVTAKRSFS